MNAGRGKLTTPEVVAAARAAIASWRRDPGQPVDCPVCGTSGVVLSDRSARPVTEWYQFQCKTCGLDEALAIPMGSSPVRLD